MHPARLACASLLILASAAPTPQLEPARLQLLNGSTEPVDVYWLESETSRVPQGSIAPGGQKLLDTFVGHRFELVPRGDGGRHEVLCRVRVQGVRLDSEDPDGIPRFYTQRTDAHGFPIVASAQVDPYALREAVYLVDLMLAHRPDVRQAMIASGARMCVMAHDEFTTELPEFAWLAREPVQGFEELPPKDYWDARARGLGGSETDPFCSVAEENLLGFEGDPYAQECILIHEFAHNIHLRGLTNVDPSFDGRLRATYEEAMAKGLWKGKYAATNHHEYFAEGVQSWFDNNRVNDFDHNHVNTRALLIEYDPGLTALCREVFGDTELRYTKPATRLMGHLEGYRPTEAPSFAWPPRLLEAQGKVRAAAAARDRAANGQPAREGGR